MGVTLHYRGTMDDIEQVTELQSELADIAKILGWSYRLMDDDWAVLPNATLVHEHGFATIKGHLGLKGISLLPTEGGEALSFFMDVNGRLRSIMDMIPPANHRSFPDSAWVSVKTQFLSPDVHVWIVGLLKYLQKRYFSNLEVNDEGGFWETGDKVALTEKIRLLNEKIGDLKDFTSVLIGVFPGLTAEEIADQIERFLKKQEEMIAQERAPLE